MVKYKEQMVNRVGSYFPKGGHSATETKLRYYINKRHRNSDTTTGNREPQQNYCLNTVSNELLGGLNWFYGANQALSF